MRAYILILLTIQFAITSCKQDVEFSSLASAARPEQPADIPDNPDEPDEDETDIPVPGDQFVRKTDSLSVKGSGRTDILFVIDNSTSMRNEQKKISQRFNKFIDKIDGLDWNIAITTTDPRGTKEWSDGRLVPFANGEYYLTSQLAKEEAQKLFGKNVQRDESGSDTEMGILSTYRSIERAMNPKTKADREMASFFRDEAALAVVVVSDEDESGKSDKNIGKNLKKLVQSHWGSKKTFQFNSIVVHTQQCLFGEGATMGRAYLELSKLTEGIVGDICADDYSKMLSDLGKGVADLTKLHTLKCRPQDIDNDGKVDIHIEVKNGAQVPGYAINGQRLEFDTALSADEYDIHYFCAE